MDSRSLSPLLCFTFLMSKAEQSPFPFVHLRQGGPPCWGCVCSRRIWSFLPLLTFNRSCSWSPEIKTMAIYVHLTWTMDCRLIFLSDFLFLFLQHHGVHCWPFWKGGECSEKQQLVKHDMRGSEEKRLLPCIGTTAFSHCDKVDNLNSICAVAGIIFHDLRFNVRWKTFVWCHYVWNVYLT